MSSQSVIAADALVPLIRYREVGTAIDWLCGAFGFEKHVVVKGPDGAIIYAQLRCGNGLVMVCPAEGSGLDAVMRQPDDLGGVATQCCYLVVADADAHYRRAISAGAEIVHDGQSDAGQSDAGGRRGYSCRDLEGHIWSFGTFDPWRNQPAMSGGISDRRASVPGRRSSLRGAALRAAAVAAVVLVTGVGASMLYEPAQEAIARWSDGRQLILNAEADQAGRRLERQLAAANEAHRDAQLKTRELQQKLDAERQDRQVALRAADALKADLQQARLAKEKAVQELAASRAAAQSLLVRAEQAEAKAAVAAEVRQAKPGDIETGSSGPSAADPKSAAAADVDPPKPVVRPRAARSRVAKPKYVIVEKDWSSFAAW